MRIEQGQQITVNESQSFKLTCNATASPMPNIYWNTSTLKSNFSLMETSQVIIEPLNKSQPDNRNIFTLYLISQVLHIEHAHIDDNENIFCQAENDVGKATAIIEINVLCKCIR